MAVQPELPIKKQSNEPLRFFFASFSQGFAGLCTKYVIIEQINNCIYLFIYLLLKSNRCDQNTNAS
jgi:hypothetical protein